MGYYLSGTIGVGIELPEEYTEREFADTYDGEEYEVGAGEHLDSLLSEKYPLLSYDRSGYYDEVNGYVVFIDATTVDIGGWRVHDATEYVNHWGGSGHIDSGVMEGLEQLVQFQNDEDIPEAKLGVKVVLSFG